MILQIFRDSEEKLIIKRVCYKLPILEAVKSPRVDLKIREFQVEDRCSRSRLSVLMMMIQGRGLASWGERKCSQTPRSSQFPNERSNDI